MIYNFHKKELQDQKIQGAIIREFTVPFSVSSGQVRSFIHVDSNLTAV